MGLNTWLTQKAMARILGVTQQDISVHARSILAENKKFQSIFVRKMKTENQRSRRNYYHQVFLEMISERVRTKSAERFKMMVGRNRKGLGLRMLMISE